MKKILISTILLSIFSLLFACTSTNVPEIKMLARINENGEEIAVTVLESEYTFGDFFIITSEKTKFENAVGEKLTKQDLSPGDTVEITYNGQMMLSYPPKVVALKIVVK